VAAIAAGTARLVPQKEAGASFQGLVDDDVARLDFGADVVALDRQVRGCDPSPGAWAQRGDEMIRLYGSRVDSRTETDESPGRILSIDESGLRLAVRGGVLRIQKVRGRGAKCAAHESDLQVGDRLV